VHEQDVLDIACGEGYGSAYLASSARWVHGVDIAPDVISHAQSKYQNINLTYHVGSAIDLSIFPDHSFDVIVSFETIEHLTADHQHAFLRETRRLLRPSGRLIVSTPNRETYTQTPEEQNPYHHHEMDLGEFVELLAEYYPHHQLFAQHEYPTSAIWPLSNTTQSADELLMRLNDQLRFERVLDDQKSVGYLIAICSQQPIADKNRSYLLDLSEVAFRGIPNRDSWQTSSLLLAIPGQGYHAMYQSVQYADPFRLEFSVPADMTCDHLRWDPLENRCCRLVLESVEVHDVSGRSTKYDPRTLQTNGVITNLGEFDFSTVDPYILIPFSGSVRQVVIQGTCSVSSGMETIAILRNLIEKQVEKIQQYDEILRNNQDKIRLLEEKQNYCQGQAQHIQSLITQIAAQTNYIDSAMAQGTAFLARQQEQALEIQRLHALLNQQSTQLQQALIISETEQRARLEVQRLCQTQQDSIHTFMTTQELHIHQIQNLTEQLHAIHASWAWKCITTTKNILLYVPRKLKSMARPSSRS
jgi:SAM-dependent methyltransferase